MLAAIWGSWGYFGPSWLEVGGLGVCWGGLGEVLGRFWEVLGVMLGLMTRTKEAEGRPGVEGKLLGPGGAGRTLREDRRWKVKRWVLAQGGRAGLAI